METPAVDHVVVNARDNLDHAYAVYKSLGFSLTQRGHHSFGSMNHLAVFAGSYLELIGLPADGSAQRRDLLAYPVGLNGLVFKSEDAAKTFESLESVKAPFYPPVDFTRPLALDGQEETASFSGIFMKPGVIDYGRVFFCCHHTPQFVWRTEWQTHDNGSTDIERMTIVAENPQEVCRLYSDLFGQDAISERAGGKSLNAGEACIDIVTAETFRTAVGPAAAAPQGRSVYMAGLTLRTTSLEKTRYYFNSEKFSAVQTLADRVVVPAHLALNATLEFIER